MLLVCPTNHGTWYRYVKDQPGAPIAVVFPEGPIASDRDVLLAPIRGAANPNAALLLTGWIASKWSYPLAHGPRERIPSRLRSLALRLNGWVKKIKGATLGNDVRKKKNTSRQVLG